MEPVNSDGLIGINRMKFEDMLFDLYWHQCRLPTPVRGKGESTHPPAGNSGLKPKFVL